MIRIRRTRLCIHHEIQFARKIINNRDFFRYQQRNVRRAQLIGLLCMRELFLDVAHGVVAKITHQPAAKTRQRCGRFNFSHFELSKILFDVIQRVSHCDLSGNGAAEKFSALKTPHFNACFCGESNERITPKTFATDYGFEQIGIRLVGELEVDRQRRVKIGKGLKHEGNAVVASKGQPFKFDFSHALLHTKPGKTVYSGPRVNDLRGKKRDERLAAPATPTFPGQT